MRLPFTLALLSINCTPIHGSEVSRGLQDELRQDCHKPTLLHGRVKAFAKDTKQLGNTLGVVDRVSRVVGMEFGLRKCVVAHIEQGKLV